MSKKQERPGMCAAGKHGVDYKGQPCDLCALERAAKARVVPASKATETCDARFTALVLEALSALSEEDTRVLLDTTPFGATLREYMRREGVPPADRDVAWRVHDFVKLYDGRVGVLVRAAPKGFVMEVWDPKRGLAPLKKPVLAESIERRLTWHDAWIEEIKAALKARGG